MYNFKEYFYVITMESSDIHRHNHKLFICDPKYTLAFETGNIINAKRFETKLRAATGLLTASEQILKDRKEYDTISNELHLDPDEEDLYMSIRTVGLNTSIVSSINILESYGNRGKFRLNFTNIDEPIYLTRDNKYNYIELLRSDDYGDYIKVSKNIEDAVYVPKSISKYVAKLIFDTFQQNDVYFRLTSITNYIIGKLESIELVSDDGTEVIETYMNKYIKE